MGPGIKGAAELRLQIVVIRSVRVDIEVNSEGRARGVLEAGYGGVSRT